eukprot:TRINITY_DN12784_c0_g1_i1.p1 TRINITY_DN12784_c0_g1~~TRINITY_DN12784_c0_g1_i1.p1  ORF type:complete len:305 (+),score=78.73 TRINITY_DN12784_c0_g1_i1:132-1046(+)
MMSEDRRGYPEDASQSNIDFYSASSEAETSAPLMGGERMPIGEKKKNWPPCRPIIHHDISIDIAPSSRKFIRRAYVGWWFHSFALGWNAIALSGSLIMGEVVGGFFIGLAAFLVGVPASFIVYYVLYKALKQASAALFAMWFCLFGTQIILEIFFAIGSGGTGAAGIILMIETFNLSRMVLGIFIAISAVIWCLVALFNVLFIISARKEYSDMGGHKAAGKDFAKQSAQAAYDNRDAIKQVAIDNREVIVDFAKENKDVIIDFAKENREATGRLIMDNRDTIWENREVISEVFDTPVTTTQQRY